MTDRVRHALRTCFFATLFGAAALPMGSALAQEEGAEPTPIRSLEPVRLYVKSLNLSGELRQMTVQQVIDGMFDRGLVGQEPVRIEAARKYAERLVRKAQLGKLLDGERQPNPTPTSGESSDGPLGIVGGGVAEVEPNDSLATAQPLLCGQFTCSSISPAADVDIYSLSLPSQTQITVTTSGDPGGDTVIGVFDAAGTLVDQNDDFGVNAYSHCVAPCVGPGTVYVLVQCFDANATIANYSLSVDACLATTDLAEVEPNNTLATRNNIGTLAVPGQKRGCGFLNPGPSDLDYQGFTLPVDSFITLTNGPLIGFGDCDASIRLNTSGGTTLVFDAAQFVPGGTSISLGLRAGSYSDRVRGKFSNTPNANWFVQVDAIPAAATDELEPDNSTAQASPLACNLTVNGIFSENLAGGLGDADYYAFTIPAGPSQPVTLLSGPSPLDTFLELYAPDGVTVLANNDNIDAVNLNSEIDIALAPGTYFVRASGPNPNAGTGDPEVPYTLALMCPGGLVELEPNNSAATATAGLTCAGSIAGRVGATPDNDYFSFTLVAEAAVTATLAAGANSADVAVIAPDGTTVLSHGTNGTLAVIDAGSYFVRVASGASGGFPYTLMLGCAATPVPVDVEPNDTVGGAGSTSCGANKVGLLSPRDSDVDYWSFNLSQWSLVTATLTVPDTRSSVDPFLEIVDPFGNPLRTNDDFGASANSQLLMNLPPGTWYAAVRSSTTGADADPRPDKDLYELHILSCTASVCATAQPLLTDNGQTTLGAIIPSGSSSRPMGCLTFSTTDASTNVDVTVSSNTIEPSVILTDGSGNYLDYDDDDGDGEAANICTTVPPGTYFLRVQNFGQGTGNFSVTTKFTTVANAGESEPDDVPSLATPIASTATVAARLLGQADVDYYRFDVTDPTNPASPLPRGLTIEARSCAGHDNSPQLATNLAIALYDVTATLIATQDIDNGPDADEFFTTSVPVGRYYVAVSTSSPVDPKGGDYELRVITSDDSLLLSPQHGPLMTCSQFVPFRAQVQNLAGRVFRGDFDLFMQVGGSADVQVLTRVRNVGLGGADVMVNRTVAQWLSRAGIPCPGSPTHARFTLVSYMVDRTTSLRLGEMARSYYDFTITP